MCVRHGCHVFNHNNAEYGTTYILGKLGKRRWELAAAYIEVLSKSSHSATHSCVCEKGRPMGCCAAKEGEDLVQ